MPKPNPWYAGPFRIQLELRGRDHPDVAQSIHNLGTLLVQQGRYSDAEAPLREALELRRQLLEPDHPDLAESLNNILVMFMLKGDLDAAEPLAYEVPGAAPPAL